MRLAALCVLTLSGCSSSVGGGEGPFASEDDYRAQRAAAVADLEETVGVPAASRLEACQTIGLGERACGGPAAYAIYSTEAADSVRVGVAADRVTALDRLANGQFEYVSTCVLLSPPPVALRDGVCVAAR